MEWKLFADLAERAGEKRVTVNVEQDTTVRGALDALLADRPALAERVVTEDGTVRSEINVLHNGTDVRAESNGLETTVEAGDELALFPPVSGG